MKSLCNVAKGADENAIGSLGKRRIRIEKAIHVLYVGPVDRCGKVYDALLDGPRFRLTVTIDYRKLWQIPMHESPQAVILHITLFTFELEFISLFIRQRWPRAKLLVVCSEKNVLDDPFYDECVKPTAALEIIHSTIERLTGGCKKPHNSSSVSEGFTLNDCAHSCAHTPSKTGTIQAVWIATSDFCSVRKRILYSGL